MNQSILNILHVVLSACRSQIAILVEVPLNVAIDGCGQCVQTNIKLPIFVQKWFLTVLLNNVTSFFTVYHIIAHDLTDLT